jgi:hypothetical protein
MKAPRPLHLEIQRHRSHAYGIIRSSYRENGRVKHTTHGRITGMSVSQLKLLQAAFRGEVIPKDSPQALQISGSKEYGASAAVLAMAHELGLDRAIYSRRESWVQDVLAMIVGRVVNAGSKLALSNQWKNTTLWEQAGVTGPVDVDKHCYAPMDRLLARQGAIEKTLAARHLTEGRLVLYDITSSYFEGDYDDSEIVLFGYNRDGKRGHEQMVIALVCNEEGCPVGVEVFPGNTQDAGTVPQKIAHAKRRSTAAKIGSRVGRVLQRYKMGKFVIWEIRDGRLHWQFDPERIAAECLLDGCYVVCADVKTDALSAEDLVAAYKKLRFVEIAFRNLKTVQLEVRPVFHKTDDRIRAHVFLCVLAYYLQWHMKQRLQPLFDNDGEGKCRQWTFENVIQRLMAIRRDNVTLAGVEFFQVTTPEPDQQHILDLLRVRL